MDNAMPTCWGPDFDQLRATGPETADVVFGEPEVSRVAGSIARVVRTDPTAPGGSDALARVASEVAELVAAFPAYPRG